LPLSSAERDYLRTAASTLAATPPTAGASPAEAPATSSPLAEADPAAEMQDIANELDRLAATGGGEWLAGLQGRWQRLHQRILDDFAQSEARLRAANVPDVILQRHAAAVADYAAEAGEVARELDAAGDGKAGVEA